ncbi:MAG: transposase, partial [Gammaproteobacteria bacterium]|nr:transposase [Gammaproteobacteria bacterium]
GETSELLTRHCVYESQGTSEVSRQEAYRGLFQHQMDQGIVKAIRTSTNGNFVLGSQKFQSEVEVQLGRRVTRGVSGRLCKQKSVETSAFGREA